MNIRGIKKSMLTNALHVQFILAVLLLGDKFHVIRMKLSEFITNLKAALEKEEESYRVIQKSDISGLKAEADVARDNLVLGMRDALKSLLRHFDANIRAAANRIKIVYDAYNRPTPLGKLSYNAETAAINNMLQDLESKHAQDLIITGIKTWTDELKNKNEEFNQLATSYYEQQSEKPLFHAEEARKETDKAYNEFITVLAGLLLLDKENKTVYEDFVKELNVIVKSYNDQIAQHQGRLHAEDEDDEE
jgi:hypothetical protein